MRLFVRSSFTCRQSKEVDGSARSALSPIASVVDTMNRQAEVVTYSSLEARICFAYTLGTSLEPVRLDCGLVLLSGWGNPLRGQPWGVCAGLLQCWVQVLDGYCRCFSMASSVSAMHVASRTTILFWAVPSASALSAAPQARAVPFFIEQFL